MVYDPPEDYPPKRPEDSEQPPPPAPETGEGDPSSDFAWSADSEPAPDYPYWPPSESEQPPEGSEQTPPPTHDTDEIASLSGFVWSTDSAPMPDYPYWPLPESAPPAAKKGRSIVSHAGRLVRDLVETVILALLIFLAVRAMVQNFRVDGDSMEVSLHDEQYILVNKAVYFKVDLGFLDFLPFYEAGDDATHYIFRAPRRGDIVVFRFPAQQERDFIKRIIAEPGETVEVRDNLVFINGKPIIEDYIKDKPMYNFGPEVVPEGNYFVLGDNRNNSYDSHTWGMLEEKYIIGRAWVSYWPFDNFGLISDPHLEPLGSGNETP